VDNLEIIRQVLAQHKVILGQLKSAGDTVSDMEALLRLESARTDLTMGFQQTLGEKMSRLEKIIAPIDQGMRKHYTFEEEMLPPLLGELFTEALILEHKQLLLQMEQTLSFVKGIEVEGLTRAEEMKQESLIYDRLDILRRRKLDHLNREEAVLLTLQNVIEVKTKTLKDRR
jgi:hypothetical protein